MRRPSLPRKERPRPTLGHATKERNTAHPKGSRAADGSAAAAGDAAALVRIGWGQDSSAATSSATCTAFRAAPLRKLSLEMNKDKPFSAVSSARMRPTYDGSRPAASNGVGTSDNSTPGAVASSSRARAG